MGEASYVLSSALEDYLETVYEQVRDQGFARVKDIAKARRVRAGSVSPAMKRLANLGLIRYAQREYIHLTPDGEREARRVYARHQVLRRFFGEILHLTAEDTERNACGMEHNLSISGMDRLVQFLEFLQGEKEGRRLITRFHASCDGALAGEVSADPRMLTLAELPPGRRARITRIAGEEMMRRRLLDMGILPDAEVEVERSEASTVWVNVNGDRFAIERDAAAKVELEKTS